jgi:ubiquinone/menaquinone biosynthesis C-methylase UbiE
LASQAQFYVVKTSTKIEIPIWKVPWGAQQGPLWFESQPCTNCNNLSGAYGVRLNPVRRKEIVRVGYNKIASSYATKRTANSEDVQLLNLLVHRLPKRAVVLDAGCGSGYPVAQILAQFFEVNGVDFADEQIRLASRNLPDSTFVKTPTFRRCPSRRMSSMSSAHYAIIHVPRREHSKIMIDFHRILKTGGLALLCMGGR